jgi:hypothetical protein
MSKKPCKTLSSRIIKDKAIRGKGVGSASDGSAGCT